jgi:hypothetical protein
MPTSFLALDSSLFHFYTALSFVLYYSPSFSQQRRKKGVVLRGGALFIGNARGLLFYCRWVLSTERERKRKTSAPKAFVLSRKRVKVARKLLFSRVGRSLCDVLFSMRGKYTQAKARARLF